MKHSLNAAVCRKHSTVTGAQKAPAVKMMGAACTILFLLVSMLALQSCTKEAEQTAPAADAPAVNLLASEGADVLEGYTGLSMETMWELRQARAATAKYQILENAFRDGYIDINLPLPNMGYHFMKVPEVDTIIDIRKPEILIYNHDANGNMELVAVEYAVPIALQPDHAPAGFSGDNDVWTYHTGFGLWLLHTWIWKYNPAGVFNPTNPLVMVH